MSEPLEIGDVSIRPGSRVKLKLAAMKLYTDTEMSIPVEVIRAKKSGPTIFISAAIHGDELNGIEIIRRLLTMRSLKLSKGTLIAVPIVNVYGMLNQSRYMPDRRDLNRCFPGSQKGSLAGRLAHLFLTEIVSKCDYGIDLHTGAIHRSNFPQIRANLEDPETQELARAFGVPVLLNASLRDGSLRGAATEEGTRVLLYEAGQALRFDELSIRAGIKGIMNVLAHLGMIRRRTSKNRAVEPFVAYNSSWIRATASGIVRDRKKLGDHVKKDEVLAEINSPTGEAIEHISAPKGGIIIGKQNIPLVQEGDAMFHIADFDAPCDVAEHIEQLQDNLVPEQTIHLEGLYE
ncbi:succinylglutamate desuccinylase/aspartoacylase family protein [Alteromonas sp. a30]|uniref:succinylglutamate desuccinylase/aspartoacylase family protein n=1 Tax=Alteromonas sp. a30 TaxID=2730917 RepID=UPI002280C92C|nr:succinylglutamate desuccinylase/aspartoacylase family protein [Alteromonas sp. a30]MCY7297230.1 succinylglutamate desuccinylase/aspartoacylase family protein [Alteromonas sp. a30]